MANNLATLSSKLATQLRDTAHETWNSTEKDDLVTWAVARLYPHLARRIDPTTTTVTLVTETYFYSAPSGVIEVEQIELVDADDVERGFLNPQAWHTVGDEFSTLKIRVAPTIVEAYVDGTLRVHGYGRYDTSTNLIPDDFVPLVLAMARVEAYRRMGGDRAQFLQWQASEQNQDMSVGELLSLVNEAEVAEERLWRRYRTQRRPRPGRLG